jgi:hypothetical protein
MPKLLNITGKRFFRLVVIKQERSSKAGKTMWLCQCDCVKNVIVSGYNLKSGHTKSCGCFKSETKANLKHGQCYTRLYHIWCSMKRRCYAKEHKEYSNYSGRGIKICDEWINDFDMFSKWAFVNGYADNLTIDRINNDGNYEPNNCQWISLQDNVRKARLTSKEAI